MNNAIETNPSPVTLAADSVKIQLHPEVAAIVETHHEQADTDKLARDIQEAGIAEAQPAGASVPPSTTTSPVLVKSIEEKTKEVIQKKHESGKTGWLKRISDLMRSGRQQLGQLKAA